MAPIRRYLRISKYSVIECRIYLDNPALAESWLLRSRNPVLPRIIESVRPLVLPKIREENERSKGKGGKKKKKAIKDVVVEDDFEVSIFLTDISTRHSVLTKRKFFRDPDRKSLESNSQKLTGATAETAMEVEDMPTFRREESEDDALNLHDLPAAEDGMSDEGSLFVAEDEAPGRSKRPRAARATDSYIESSPDSEPLRKRRKDGDVLVEDAGEEKKKMAMETSYDGFAIYGHALCLVVKRKDKKGKGPATSRDEAMMENWIISTQMPPQEVEDGP